MRHATVIVHPSAKLGNSPDALRAKQIAAYIDDDFGRYFSLTERLAAICPGYGRSYEYWIHTVLHALARNEPETVFLQVGAMDGKRFDPIYAFVRHYAWRGLILEPLPDLFAELRRNYAGQANVTLVNAALADADCERAMFRVGRDAVHSGAVPLWAEGLGTFFPERNALGGVGLDADQHAVIAAHARQERVACLTLRSLAERWPLPHIDLLQVDAEGCELDILRQVDRAGYRPSVIHLEHWALPANERAELLGLLGERGYRLRMSEADVMAVDAGLQGAIDAAVGWPC
jgi:FkbM family methyltransferase